MQQRTRDRGIEETSGHEKTPTTCVDGVEEVDAAKPALETAVAPLHSRSFLIELQQCHSVSVCLCKSVNVSVSVVRFKPWLVFFRAWLALSCGAARFPSVTVWRPKPRARCPW